MEPISVQCGSGLLGMKYEPNPNIEPSLIEKPISILRVSGIITTGFVKVCTTHKRVAWLVGNGLPYWLKAGTMDVTFFSLSNNTTSNVAPNDES